jgi:hypothetical protein
LLANIAAHAQMCGTFPSLNICQEVSDKVHSDVAMGAGRCIFEGPCFGAA